MRPRPKNRKKLIFLGFLSVCIAILSIMLLREQVIAPELTNEPPEKKIIQEATQDELEEAVFDKKRYSLSTSSSLWVIVNKQRPLPSSYTPAKLRTPKVALRGGNEMLLRDDAADALEAMTQAAAKKGIALMLVSGYRSYSLQAAVYHNFVRRDGQAAADRYSAKPGHSEHQTGLAADVGSTSGGCQLMECFAQTTAGKWVAANAADYGFVVRYEKGTEKTVGYNFEPWHLRFVGKDLAREVTKQDTTLEEFFGLPAAPDYR